MEVEDIRQSVGCDRQRVTGAQMSIDLLIVVFVRNTHFRVVGAANADEHAGIQLDSGDLLVNGVFYDRGTAPASMPVAWVNGGNLRIGGAQSITNEPMTVHKAGGNVEILDGSLAPG